jgi:type III restriction enzyme
MGEGTAPKAPLVIEIDRENPKKDIPLLDIRIPVLTPRVFRDYKNFSDLDITKFDNKKFPVIIFTEEQKREIVFRDITTNDISHKTVLDSNFVANYQSVIGYFTEVIRKDLRLVGGYDILYGKVKGFIRLQLFEKEVNIDDANILRNLSEPEVNKTIVETFKRKINELTVLQKGEAEIRDYIKISECRPFVSQEQGYLLPKKSVFNKIIGDSGLELEFAGFLENCDDIMSYVKNYFAVNFKIDYQNQQGDISNYYPDFIVKKSENEIFIIETKGLEDVDVKLKIARLDQWCKDINKIQTTVKYAWLLIREEEFKKYRPKNFGDLVKSFENKI